jgi:hypothetical protein
MLSRLKSTHAFKQEFSSRLEQIILTSNLPITFNYGAFGLHLGLEQLKDRMVKSDYNVSSSSINLHSIVFVDFQNKTQRFLLYEPFWSLICGISRSFLSH